MKSFVSKTTGLPVFLFLVLFGWSTAFSQSTHESQEFMLPPDQMGETLLQMGQYEPAHAIYSKLYETGSEGPYVIRGLVKSLAGLKKLDKARQQLDAYLQEKPNSSSVLYGLGLLHYMESDAEKAESYLTRAIEQSKTNAPAHNTLAVILFDRKKYKEAIGQLQKALAANPADLLIYRNLWRTYGEMGLSSQFLSEFEGAKKEKSKVKMLGYGRAYASALRQEGFGLYEKGDVPGALSKMNSMLTVYREVGHLSGEVSALFSLALLEEESGKIEQAVNHYKTLLKINPDHIQARDRLGQIEQQIKKQ